MKLEKNILEYIKRKGITIAAIAQATNIKYGILYDSLGSKSRDRGLKADEFLKICKFLGVTAESFNWEEEL